jgi:hypothetical protein
MTAYVSSSTTDINIPPTVSKKLNIALIVTMFCFCAFILNNCRTAHFSELPMATHRVTTHIITSHVCDLNLLTLIRSLVQYDYGINSQCMRFLNIQYLTSVSYLKCFARIIKVFLSQDRALHSGRHNRSLRRNDVVRSTASTTAV